MSKKKQMNFRKRADLFREKLLLGHLIKVWNCSHSRNNEFSDEIYDKAEHFISKIYGKQWLDLITDSEKFDDWFEKEENWEREVYEICEKHFPKLHNHLEKEN
tara:strand:+ start:484 stop:792 length:309 start_codon:yes stop_codon:yes gene_type:complete